MIGLLRKRHELVAFALGEVLRPGRRQRGVGKLAARAEKALLELSRDIRTTDYAAVLVRMALMGSPCRSLRMAQAYMFFGT